MTTVGSEWPPTVSAVLPLHNGERFVRPAVESIMRQSAPPIELLVVDDGSTDRSLEALQQLDLPFPMKVVHQGNLGQSAARNHAARLAAGELLAFIDQDDLWHVHHLAELTAPFSDPEVGWAYSDFDEIDGSGRTVTISFLRERSIAHPKATLAACIEGDLMVLPSASVIRRTAFEQWGGFDEELHGYEDDDLYVRAFRSGWRLVLIDRSLTRFRVHQDSSSAGGTFVSSRLRFAEKLEQEVEDDRRLNRRWFRDVVAPRFLRASLDDYIRAISDADWDEARRTLEAVEYFAVRTRDPAWARRLVLLRHPRVAARLLGMHQLLPRSLRLTDDPLYRLR